RAVLQLYGGQALVTPRRRHRIHEQAAVAVGGADLGPDGVLPVLDRWVSRPDLAGVGPAIGLQYALDVGVIRCMAVFLAGPASRVTVDEYVLVLVALELLDELQGGLPRYRTGQDDLIQQVQVVAIPAAAHAHSRRQRRVVLVVHPQQLLMRLDALPGMVRLAVVLVYPPGGCLEAGLELLLELPGRHRTLHCGDHVRRQDLRILPVEHGKVRVFTGLRFLAQVVIVVQTVRHAQQPAPGPVIWRGRVDRVQCREDIGLPCVWLHVSELVYTATG